MDNSDLTDKTKDKPTFDWDHLLVQISLPIFAMLLALFLGGILLVLLDVRPGEAYLSMLTGAFGEKNGIIQSLVMATPLLLVGLGITIAFRASVINIGGEGQIILGALGATSWTLYFREWPSWALIPSAIVVSFIAGGFWGFIPGILKAKFKVNEILSTVMLNAIALQLMNMLVRGPLMDPQGVETGMFLAQSEKLPEVAWLTRLVKQSTLNTGAIIALVLAVLVYIFLWRTTIGFRIRSVGLNPHASRYAGMNVPYYQAFSLTLAGGFAGIAGAVEVMGTHRRLIEGITGGYGFSGIVVALFGGLHPIGAIPASYLFGSLLVGADKMQRATQVPSALIQVLLGLVVLFVVGSAFLSKKFSYKALFARIRGNNKGPEVK